MADHALVVGCDAYPNVPDGDLSAAVRDALAVRDWLLDPDGGGVDAQDLVLLASPSDGGARTDPTAVRGPAGIAAFAEALQSLVDRDDVDEADRVYVYFAGHGCRTDPFNAIVSVDAIAFTDFSPSVPARDAGGVDDLCTRLEQSRFGSVVVLVDACRDLPFHRPFRLGGLGLDVPVPSGRRVWPRLYLGQATIPGGSATARDPALGGDFTRAVVAGLRGDAGAKVFDERSTPPYLVRWSTLRAYVESRVPDARMIGDGELTLSTFADGWFDQVRLEVDVEPEPVAVAPDLRVRVRYPDPNRVEDGDLDLGGPAPVTALVPPRRHQVVGRGARHHGKQWFDVYADAQVRLRMQREREPEEARPEEPDDGDDGALEVVTDDPCAAIEVRSQSGHEVGHGIGRVRAVVEPGAYTVGVIDQDGNDLVQTVDIERDLGLRLRLHAPEPGGEEFRLTLGAFGPLRWASGAALAVTALPSPPHGSRRPRIAVVVASSMDPAEMRYRAESLVTRIDGLGAAGSGWLTTADVDDADGEHDVLLWAADNAFRTRLGVPVVRGADTAVFTDGKQVVIGLFDHAAHGDPLELLRLDRSQRYLARRRPREALDILRAAHRPQRTAGPVEELLKELADRGWSATLDPHDLTVGSVHPDDRAGLLLGTGLWRVAHKEVNPPSRGREFASSPTRPPDRGNH